MEELSKIFSSWWGWAVAGALAFSLAVALLEKLRKFIFKVLADYVITHLQRIWYWISNKAFTVSGYVEYSFAAELSHDERLKNRFDDAMGNNDSPVLLERPYDFNVFKVRLRERQDLPLIIQVTGSEELYDLYSADATGFSTPEGAGPEAKTILNVKWDRVLIQYREFSAVITNLRQATDFIKEQFAPFANNRIPGKQSAFLRVFFRQDCKVDQTVKLNISLAQGSVNLKKIIGEVDFGARSLEAIAPYLPQHLIKQTLRDLLKQHGLVS